MLSYSQMSLKHLSTCVIVTLFAVSGAYCSPLPCNSPLRLRIPSLFSHCDCAYSQWSEWQLVEGSAMSVPKSQCPDSGEAYTESRTRTSVGSGCDETTETQQICFPDKADQLMITLGLGGGNNDYKSLRPITQPSPQPPSQPPELLTFRLVEFLADEAGSNFIIPAAKPYCPNSGRTSSIVCSGITQGKRSITNRKDHSSLESDLDRQFIPKFDPKPFNIHKHGHRLRRQANLLCNLDETQHILFLMDTSGSIGGSSFQQMKDALSKLTLLFCKPVKLAAMTFNHEYKLEFCFNCFDNTICGRGATAEAIRNIQYRYGLTHTGGAAKCVCSEALKPSCGIPEGTGCIDVVFITDGHSNDPSLKICDEVNCLHNHPGVVNTYAIGINGYNVNELNCIKKSSSLFSAFKFNSFDEFASTLQNITERVNNIALGQDSNYPGIHPYACYSDREPTIVPDPNNTPAPNGEPCPPQ